MKAIKFLLIVIGLVSALTLSAETTDYPVAQMHSTSAMIGSGSTLPNAASSGFISADDNLNSSSNNNTPTGPRRAKEEGDTPPTDPPGPNEYPLGDTPWLLMLLLALGYALRVGKKYGHQLPDAGK